MFMSRRSPKSVLPVLLAAMTLLAMPSALGACDDGDVLPPPTSDRVADDDGVLGDEDPSGSSGSSGTDDGSGGTDASTSSDAGSDASGADASSTDAGDAG